MTEFGATFPVQSIGTKAGDQVKVGFVFVGPINDYGYNQAANEGRLLLEKLMPNVKTVYAENVPETSACERAMEQMVAQGCKILFPTSYGYLDFAMNVGNRHKDIVLLHQGGLKNSLNVGTYFGTIWQMVYSAGVAAGKLTKSNKLGFVAAHPIPQVLLNINAFHLGAFSVNPTVTTQVVFTGDWCIPDKQTEAATSLIGAGADVISQHQDCSGAVIQATERLGAMSVGYHADASPLAPKGWLTGSIWTWGNLYAAMVLQIVAGTWKSSILRGGVDAGIVNLAPFGPAVTPDVKTLVDTTKAGIVSGSVTPFKGPIVDQTGKTRIPSGPQPDDQTLETTDYLVKGVTGTLTG